jgi:streptogramin lyase
MIKLSIISLFLALAIIGCQNNTSKELDELQNFRAGNRKPQINFSDTTIKYNSTLISDPTSLDNNYRCGSFDSLGYLWLGKANTLVRYNGYDFKKFSYHPYIKNGIPAGEIKKLKIDKNNKIWILSSGFVYRFDPL